MARRTTIANEARNAPRPHPSRQQSPELFMGIVLFTGLVLAALLSLLPNQ